MLPPVFGRAGGARASCADESPSARSPEAGAGTNLSWIVTSRSRSHRRSVILMQDAHQHVRCFIMRFRNIERARPYFELRFSSRASDYNVSPLTLMLMTSS
jgi:hypothetical protein